MGILSAENMPNGTMEELIAQHFALATLASTLAVTVAYACEGRPGDYADISGHLQTPQLVYEGVPEDTWQEDRAEADDDSTLGDLLVEVASIGLSEEESEDLPDDAVEGATTLVHNMIATCHSVQEVLTPEQLFFLLYGMAMADLSVGGDGYDYPEQNADDVVTGYCPPDEEGVDEFQPE